MTTRLRYVQKSGEIIGFQIEKNLTVSVTGQSISPKEFAEIADTELNALNGESTTKDLVSGAAYQKTKDALYVEQET